MIDTDERGYAIPGTWRDSYLASWHIAFPESLESPGFFRGELWVTVTPAWDKWWFESYGVKPPRRRSRAPQAAAK